MNYQKMKLIIYQKITNMETIQKRTSFNRKDVDKWQLVFKCNNEKIVHGNYSLCRNEQNKKGKDITKIIPFSFKNNTVPRHTS